METDKKKLGEPIQTSGALMVPAGSVRMPVKPRPRRGPDPEQMSKQRLVELQERVVAAIRAELPPDWEFMCCLMGPNGEKEVCGSLHSNPKNRNFLQALDKAMNLTTWRQGG
jgi:hypothetical protein